jgi:hypothetical protein
LGVKRDIQTREKYLFIDVPFTDIDTLVPRLDQFAENPPPLPHHSLNLFVPSETFAIQF